ncbi:MAG: hypothetical protein H6Q72_3250 [Firmicutes bacterium]|nr:hypothetical protein [Bacillota bacterium]
MFQGKGILYYISLFIVLFVSTLLAVLLKPLSNKLSKKIPNNVAIGVSLLSFLCCFIGGFIIISGSILPALTSFIKDIPGLSKDVTSFSTSFALRYPWIGSEQVVQEQVSQIMQSAIEWSVSFVKSSLGPMLKTTSNLAEMIGIPIITFYFMKDAGMCQRRIVSLFYNATKETELFFDKTTFMLSKYIQGQLAVSVISGLSVSFVGWILGVKHIVLFSFLAAIGEWIPIVGPIFAAILAITTVMVQDPLMAAKLAVFYVIMFKLNHNIIYPTLVGKATKLHPAIIVIGVLFAGHIAGAFGMLVIVPMLAILYIYFSIIYDIQAEKLAQNRKK